MGVRGLYAWLTKKKYIPKTIVVNVEDSLLIDTKLLINKIAYGLCSNDDNICQDVVDKIDGYFKKYQEVVFVNDGSRDVSPMKSFELQKRNENKNKNLQKAKDQEIELQCVLKKRKREDETDKMAFENDRIETVIKMEIEKKKRQGRKITTSMSMRILLQLNERGYKTIQCEGEADAILIAMAKDFKYVVSEDGDLLVGGVNNLLRFFGTKNLLYSDVLTFLDLTTLQLKEMACLAGCDYTSGIKGIGLKNAENFIRKYGTAQNFLQSSASQKFAKPPDFDKTIKQIVHIFTPCEPLCD